MNVPRAPVSRKGCRVNTAHVAPMQEAIADKASGLTALSYDFQRVLYGLEPSTAAQAPPFLTERKSRTVQPL